MEEEIGSESTLAAFPYPVSTQSIGFLAWSDTRSKPEAGQAFSRTSRKWAARDVGHDGSDGSRVRHDE
jgi:hypothetical protein